MIMTPRLRSVRRTAALRHGDIDDGGINRRIMRHMVRVREQKTEFMRPRRQRYLGLGLAGTKMKVVEIAGNGLVERRKFRIDDQMMMSGVRLVEARRSDAHVQQAEANDRRGRNIGAVSRIDEIDLGIFRRRLS